MRRPIIGVFGGNKIEDHVVRAAKALGRQIVLRDAILLTGGVPGAKQQVKQAAMQGALDAKNAGARLIGVLKKG
jgi:predicted Rossmann-fold nucleotide-binding protein